jgi:tRNA U55 pseudouridine synthase TruB
VRSVVHDLGLDLGCGGHLERLRRTRQGPFDLEGSLPWESLIDEGAPEAIRARVVSPAAALAFLPERPLTIPRVALRAGVFVPSEPEDSASPDAGAGGSGSVRLVHHGETVAIARAEGKGHRVLYVLPPGVGRPPRREIP